MPKKTQHQAIGAIALACSSLWLGYYTHFSDDQIHNRRSLWNSLPSVSFDPKSVQQRQELPLQSHSDKVYGHIHMAKTGGSNLNGMLANEFERVCGNKGYSYNAFEINEIAKRTIKAEHTTDVNEKLILPYIKKSSSKVSLQSCDYISMEIIGKNGGWWGQQYMENVGKTIELHVPCRDPVDHMMSQCNHLQHGDLKCDAPEEEFIQSIRECEPRSRWYNRFNMKLVDGFQVKCYDFKEQFTTYYQFMSERLEPSLLQSLPYVKIRTNSLRSKESECIWERPDLIQKTKQFLIQEYDYYQFCEACIGSENDITKKGALEYSSR